MTATHFSKAFLASVPPFDPSLQTNASDFDAASTMFANIERRIHGGFSGALLLHRTAVVHGRLPVNVTILNPTNEV